MINPFLSFHQVSYAYHNLRGETQAVKDLTFQIHEGEFVAIVGPSGCGKSTILSLISGILEPEDGEIRFCGKRERPTIGYMLQRDHLFPWRTIWANCMLPCQRICTWYQSRHPCISPLQDS